MDKVCADCSKQIGKDSYIETKCCSKNFHLVCYPYNVNNPLNKQCCPAFKFNIENPPYKLVLEDYEEFADQVCLFCQTKLGDELLLLTHCCLNYFHVECYFDEIHINHCCGNMILDKNPYTTFYAKDQGENVVEGEEGDGESEEETDNIEVQDGGDGEEEEETDSEETAVVEGNVAVEVQDGDDDDSDGTEDEEEEKEEDDDDGSDDKSV